MVCAFFIIFVSAKSFSFQLIIFSFKFMYIDTHSHIYEEEFREDREAVVQRAREAGDVISFGRATSHFCV